jgi:tetratricopeptide (TPR) repeat protein
MFFSLLQETNTRGRFPSIIRQIAGLSVFIAALGVCSSGFGQTADERFIAKKLFHGAWDLKAKGNPIAAIVLFEGGLKLVPQDATAHFHLATIYEAAGDTPSAKQHFSEVIRLAPQSAEAAKARVRLSGSSPAPQVSSSADRVVLGLEWAESDNGADINWNKAKIYCASKGSGWRLPTVAELQSNYQSGQSTYCGKFNPKCNVASKSLLTGPWFWSNEPNGSSEAWYVTLVFGTRDTNRVGYLDFSRALCVRRP